MMQMKPMNTNVEIFHPELSYKITGVLFAVHNELGRYAREKQYGDLIEKHFKMHGIRYEREVSISTSGNIADFIVDEKIVLELKVVMIFTKEHYRQIQNYLQQTNLKLGYLINFRQMHLRPKRIIRTNS
jgi:GxxExxY protein